MEKITPLNEVSHYQLTGYHDFMLS